MHKNSYSQHKGSDIPAKYLRYYREEGDNFEDVPIIPEEMFREARPRRRFNNPFKSTGLINNQYRVIIINHNHADFNCEIKIEIENGLGVEISYKRTHKTNVD